MKGVENTVLWVRENNWKGRLAGGRFYRAHSTCLYFSGKLSAVYKQGLNGFCISNLRQFIASGFKVTYS